MERVISLLSKLFCKLQAFGKHRTLIIDASINVRGLLRRTRSDDKSVASISSILIKKSWPCGYKTFFMLNQIEHKISTAL